MHVHHTLPETPILDRCALTIGTFDGVHRGHQTLVARLRTEAQKRDLPSAVLTFTDMPYCLFRPDDCPKLLTVPQGKISEFAKTGLDHLFIVPFTRAIASQSAADFMAYWKRIIGLKLLVSGPDFALGRDREGDLAALRNIGENLGFETLVLEAKLLESGAPISSTRSRGVIESGQIELSRAFLGRNYTVRGRVVAGQQLGRTIGFPTINLAPHPRKCLPKNGVYAVWARFDGNDEPYPAALNIGFRPTVGGKTLAMEFHVLDETIEAPPQTARLEFVARLRDEQKFAGLDELKVQLARDVEKAREILQ